jgi:HNH endonuclease
MSAKLLDRLLFAQGGRCFYCRQELPKSDASVEHLVATSKGGGNTDENRVACCKTVNALLGSMSLKDKFQVLLNQKGAFNCPNGADIAVSARPANVPSNSIKKPDAFEKVVANLKQRGTSRPRTDKTLRSTIAALLGKEMSETELTAVIERLLSTGKITLVGSKVSYTL